MSEDEVGHAVASTSKDTAEPKPQEKAPSDSQELQDVKKKIRRHPLFPIVEKLMEKLEVATLRPSEGCYDIDDIMKAIGDISCSPSSAPEDKQVDELMSESVRGLAMQLHELKKVNELADDFMQKYSHLLKKRIPQDSIIGSALDSDDDISPSPTSSLDDVPIGPSSSSQGAATIAMLTTPQGTVSIPLHLSTMMTACPVAAQPQVFNMSQVDKMHRLRMWMIQNLMNPQPSQVEKKQLAEEAGVTPDQVDLWAVELRRQILGQFSQQTSTNSVSRS